MSTAFCTLQLLLLLLFSLNSSSVADSNSFLKCLTSSEIPRSQLSSITYLPSNKNYTDVLQSTIHNSRFNTSTTPKPTIILTPWEESQVPYIVICAKKSGVQLKIRSGGHDYEGHSYTSNETPFIILDMFNLRSIKINMEDQTAWAQAGATLGELYYSIWKESNVHGFPAGVCPTVGLGGHISGGGYGNMLRKHGLTVDHMLDAKIVDAKGRILDRKGMGEDLFWAIRGGGGASFGVILSYKIKLVSVPPVVTVFNVPRTLEENATDIIHRWQYFAPNADRHLFVRAFMQATTVNDKMTVRASFIALYLGDAKQLISIMNKSFPELGVEIKDCKETTWVKSILFFADFPDGTPETTLLDRGTSISRFKHKSDYVKTPIPRHGLQMILKNMAKSGSIWMQFNPYGGRMAEIPDSETAFPHRAGNLYKIQYLIGWDEPGPAADKRNVDKLREFYNLMTPFVSKNPRETFLNYIDIDVGISGNGKNAYNEGKVYGVRYFKSNFDRLVRVKTAVDPDNFFRNEQSIPPLRK